MIIGTMKMKLKGLESKLSKSCVKLTNIPSHSGNTLFVESFAGTNFCDFAKFLVVRKSLYPRNRIAQVIRKSLYPQNFSNS